MLGCSEQADVGTAELYADVKNRYDVYHIHVNHNVPSERRAASAISTFGAVIGEDHVKMSTVDALSDAIKYIIVNSATQDSDPVPVMDFMTDKEIEKVAESTDEITW